MGSGWTTEPPKQFPWQFYSNSCSWSGGGPSDNRPYFLNAQHHPMSAVLLHRCAVAPFVLQLGPHWASGGNIAVLKVLNFLHLWHSSALTEIRLPNKDGHNTITLIVRCYNHVYSKSWAFAVAILWLRPLLTTQQLLSVMDPHQLLSFWEARFDMDNRVTNHRKNGWWYWLTGL